VVVMVLVAIAVPQRPRLAARPPVDWLGAALSFLALAGPTLALIRQPESGWGAPDVLGPGLGGLALLGAFLWREATTPHPMLPLELFRSRNFAIGNLATLMIYGGLGAATFFVTIFLQQVAGYTPIAAGLSLVPLTIIMALLSRRWGALSDRIGPRLLMGCGPIVAGIGLIWMGQLGSEVDYVTDLLPGILVFGLGLSATVAPLTNTVLGAVPQHHAGVASGVNNQISRVAALLAIAVVGAVVAGVFSSQPGVGDAEPLSGGSPAVVDASVEAYRAGLGLGGALVIVGGVVSLAGIVNPPRRAMQPAPAEELGAIRLAHPCPEGRRAA
jgi:predicted MFS family arabinose efflux permease